MEEDRLANGRATVDIDNAFNMTSGTFDALNRDMQCFTSNESGWKPVRGSVVGATLVIESRDLSSSDVVSWMVLGERQDPHMFESSLTDENGRLIAERRKGHASPSSSARSHVSFSLRSYSLRFLAVAPLCCNFNTKMRCSRARRKVRIGLESVNGGARATQETWRRRRWTRVCPRQR